MFDSDLVYQSLNRDVLAEVPPRSRVLDIGCGGGSMGGWLREHQGCEVIGVTHSEVEATQARRVMSHVVVADLNHFEPVRLGAFDCVVCSHVLEHLIDPVRLLGALRSCLVPGGAVVVALPNALFWRQRLAFLRGRFRYTEGGLMDRTHVRFFDWETSARLVNEAGYRVEKRLACGSLPGSRHLGRRLASWINRLALRAFPGLFGFQFVLRARASDGT